MATAGALTGGNSCPRIAEKLTGKSAQHYIPIEKREPKERTTANGERARSLIKTHIKAHEGGIVHTADLAKEAELSKATTLYHLTKLIRTGQITRETEGKKARYWLGRKVTRDNGPVTVVKPAAPVSRSGLERVNAEAWAYVRTLKNSDSLADQVRGIVGFIEHLEAHLEGKE